MQRYRQILLASLVFISSGMFAGTSFKATTTLTAQTSNNTSAADSFKTLSDGDVGATNISKVSLHTLLYPGSTAKVYVHLMPWFGFSNHMNVGYSSDDPAQVQRQVNDMISRGVDGLIVDWYGQGTTDQQFADYTQMVEYFRQDAEQQQNFNFAVTEDAGALKACAATTGCDITQTLINDLTYAYNTWEGSLAYLHYNGRPVVYFFGEEAYTLDWTQVRASVPGNPLFIFRNSVGFNYAESDGGFSWVAPETVSTSDPMALGYLATFDETALSLWPEYAIASAYKGFNDSLAAWGSGRLIQQQCGQTWLASMAESAKFYSVSKQLLGIQLATWNDYEEGTELESGIDNCVTVNATMSGTVVNWTITGEVNTVDHYTVYLSQDGENLMWLADVPVSTNSLDVTPFQMDAGNYMVFVQAVGKPSITNKMSESVSLSIPDQPPIVALAVSPTSGSAPLTVNASTAGSSAPTGSIASTTINFGDGSATVSAASATHTYNAAGTYTVTATVTDNLGTSTSKTTTVTAAAQPFAFSGSNSSATVTAGQTATYNLTLATGNSGFAGTVAITCGGAPAGTTCSASPGSVSLSGTAASASLTITVATSQQAHSAPLLLRGLPFTFAAVFAGVLGLSRKKYRRAVLSGMAVLLICGVIGCAGGASSTTSTTTNAPAPAPTPTPSSPTNATLTITGASGSQTASTTLTLTINH